MAIRKESYSYWARLQRKLTTISRAARNHGLGIGGDHVTGTLAVLGGWGSILGVGATAAFSAGVAQLHYRDELDEIKRLYEDEISEKVGKPADKVTVSDLEQVAKTNATLGEALSKAKKFRNLSIATTAVSSIATLGITTALTLAFPVLGAAGLGAFLAEAAVGIAVYNIIRVPLNAIGKKMLGISRENTTERIMEIEKERENGKSISKEQVLSVLVSANPELDERVAKNFGKKFDDMSEADKQKVVESMSQLIPLDQITAGVNQGGVDITRLAFTVEQTTTTTTADYTTISSGMPSGTGFARREQLRRDNMNAIQR